MFKKLFVHQKSSQTVFPSKEGHARPIILNLSIKSETNSYVFQGLKTTMLSFKSCFHDNFISFFRYNLWKWVKRPNSGKHWVLKTRNKFENGYKMIRIVKITISASIFYMYEPENPKLYEEKCSIMVQNQLKIFCFCRIIESMKNRGPIMGL